MNELNIVELTQEDREHWGNKLDSKIRLNYNKSHPSISLTAEIEADTHDRSTVYRRTTNNNKEDE